ncbi:MAG: type VI secretion system-associated protein TagF [Rubrivivax sp.]|nr:type VI secretion system-associated protein TagF [Rubrivivax sp.]
MNDPAPPGWHGKLPSLGDFASRRLPAAFVEPWDGWLAAGMLALREAAPEDWLVAYLGSPSWRFLLMPGVLPGQPSAAAGAADEAADQGWAGVLMPSVDRVGRYFPLTIALPLGDGPASTVQMQALWHWLARLDELARDALFDDWSLERLENELARMARPELATRAAADALPAPQPGELAEWPAGLDAATAIGLEAQALWAARSRGRGWWYACPDEGAPRLLTSQGLPQPALLGRLFGGAATIAPASTLSLPGLG